MWTRLLVLCSVVAAIQSAAWSQASDPKDLVLRVRDHVTGTLATLPKYLCSLTVERAQYAPSPVRALSCDGLAAQHSKGLAKPYLFETDRVRLDVAVAASNEIYSWVGEDRFEDRDVFDLVREGALQTGGFSSFLASIFGGNAADFSYDGETEVNGRTLAEFGFQVPMERSNYVFGNRRTHVVTGYEGTFLVDPKTGELIRLVVRTNGLPADSGACEATTTVEYQRMSLYDSEFLLPREVHLEILNTDGGELHNQTVYSNCHEFRGESAVRFDESSPAAESRALPPKPAVNSPLPLPPGIVFEVRFTQPIETGSASAGDRIRAELPRGIRDPWSKAVLVPKGAELVARILRLEHFPGPPSSVRMQVKLEAVSVGGTLMPLLATKNWVPQKWQDVTNQKTGLDGRPIDKPSRLDTSVASGTKIPLDGAPNAAVGSNRTLQRRIQVGSFDALADPAVGVFEFRDARPSFVVPSGLESNWMTEASQ
jgi:hypothetical protein